MSRLTPDQRATRGKVARGEAARSSHAAWAPAHDRPDPVALLEEQAATRVPELMPIRHGRMMVSPFTFLRGSANIMASDLAATPRSGLRVQLCGDAHAGNFRGLASAERTLLFDLNDFDETLPGPWEWDVKRLAASLVVAGRHRGFERAHCRDLARAAVREYRLAIRRFAEMSEADIWYAKIDGTQFVQTFAAKGTAKQAKQAQKAVDKAHRKDRSRAFEKLGTHVDGRPLIDADPPLVVPVEDLFPDAEAERVERWARDMIGAYRASLQGSRGTLLDCYDYSHTARKVVGVGSVGMRNWIILMVGRDDGDVLFLQCKQAEHSVLEPFAGRSRYSNMGRRVAEGQWLIQAASDVFLGWVRTTGLDGIEHDFYVRQMWDWKGKADFDTMVPSNFEIFGSLCGDVLARAHARSGDAIAIASYLGRGESFDRAIESFADAYADQTERDHDAFVAAIKTGRLAAEPNV